MQEILHTQCQSYKSVFYRHSPITKTMNWNLNQLHGYSYLSTADSARRDRGVESPSDPVSLVQIASYRNTINKANETYLQLV